MAEEVSGKEGTAPLVLQDHDKKVRTGKLC